MFPKKRINYNKFFVKPNPKFWFCDAVLKNGTGNGDKNLNHLSVYR